MRRYIQLTYTLTRDLDDSEFQRLVNEGIIVLDENGNVDYVEQIVEEEVFHQDDLEFEDAEVIEVFE